MNRAGRIAAIAVAIGAAGTTGFLARRLVATPGQPPAAAPAHPAPPAAPTELPELTLPDLKGTPQALSQWRGRPLLVNFWATWCEPCRREIPLLRQLRQKHAPERLEVLGIAIDFRDAVAAYAREAGIDYPVLVAEQDGMAAQAFGVGMGLPTSVFVDRHGRIVATHVGELHEKDAEKLLARTLEAP